MAYELDPTLVRGLDYYTRTVFEFESGKLGAQNALGGGGRYDGLVEQLGGPATPASAGPPGIERILLAGRRRRGGRADRCSWRWPSRRQRGPHSRSPASCGRHGRRTEVEQAGRSLKGQFKHADRIGATYVVIAGDGLEVKDMASGEQREVAGVDEAVDGGGAHDRHLLQPLPQRLVRRARARTTSARRSAWPAGCTAGATTAA